MDPQPRQDQMTAKRARSIPRRRHRPLVAVRSQAVRSPDFELSPVVPPPAAIAALSRLRRVRGPYSAAEFLA